MHFDIIHCALTVILHLDTDIMHADSPILHSETDILHSDTALWHSDSSIVHSDNSSMHAILHVTYIVMNSKPNVTSQIRWLHVKYTKPSQMQLAEVKQNVMYNVISHVISRNGMFGSPWQFDCATSKNILEAKSRIHT